ncbi:MAG TPA: ABC transporter permease [Candidatus Sumerlaeota bacterium]|nr:ABC transporter permease [Candidatus Sumerlaeota bacterium]
MGTPHTPPTLEIQANADESSSVQVWRRFFIFDVHFVSNLARLWHNRYLIFALTQRGVRARYKQSLIGIGWALITPLAMTAVFTYMYSALGLEGRKTFPCPPVLYLLFTLSFWNFLTRAITNGSTALVSNMDLVTKVYFPREVLPISSVLTNVVDLVFSFLLWAGVAAGYSYLRPGVAFSYPHAYPFLPHAGWLWLPVIFFFHLLLILGIVFITATLQVYFRDVGHLINLGLTLWLIITPVLYAIGAFSGGRYTTLININPMTGIIDGYRLAIISRASPWYTAPNWEHHVVGSVLFSVWIFLVGYSFFKHEEQYFADVV